MHPIFTLRLLIKFVAAGATLFMAQACTTAPARTLDTHRLSDKFSVTGQVFPDQISELKLRGYTTIVAMRPDGEAADQPAAAQIEAAARSAGLAFAYIPVKSGEAGESQIASLTAAMDGGHQQILAYCRSGSRAARMWALSEASRPHGASAAQILDAIKAAGHSAEDLSPDIKLRISRRAGR